MTLRDRTTGSGVFGALLLCAAPLAAQHAGHTAGAPPSPALAVTMPQEQLRREALEPITLEDLQRLAEANNPTLKQAAAEIAAARGRRQQGALYPDPLIGYTGEEIGGGNRRGGLQGFYVEQSFPLGGKLGLNRRAADQELVQAEAEQEEQQLRVSAGISALWFTYAAAHEALALVSERATLEYERARVSGELRRIGSMDETEVLAAQARAEQAGVDVIVAEATRERLWRALAASVAQPDMPMRAPAAPLSDTVPRLDEAALRERYLKASPAVHIADAGAIGATFAAQRARREAVPDLNVRLGAQYAGELDAGSNRPIGWVGLADIGVRVPLWNRNRGAAVAAQAQQVRAVSEQERVRLIMAERFAAGASQYRSLFALADRYRTRLVPLAERRVTLMRERFGEMGVSSALRLEVEVELVKTLEAYVLARGAAFSAAVALQNFLLVDPLEGPSAPGVSDTPIREVNLPTARGAIP